MHSRAPTADTLHGEIAFQGLDDITDTRDRPVSEEGSCQAIQLSGAWPGLLFSL